MNNVALNGDAPNNAALNGDPPSVKDIVEAKASAMKAKGRALRLGGRKTKELPSHEASMSSTLGESEEDESCGGNFR